MKTKSQITKNKKKKKSHVKSLLDPVTVPESRRFGSVALLKNLYTKKVNISENKTKNIYNNNNNFL